MERIARILLVLAAASLWVGPTLAAQDVPDEQSVRAAMVFNFLKFTEFPVDEAGNARTLRLCFAVADPVQADALVALSGRMVGRRELVVVRLAGQDDECQVLYVDSRQRWNAVSEHRAGRRALTLSNYSGFARDGGMIEIALQPEGVRFEINLAKGRRAGFRFAPQLLRLARQVYE